MFAFPLRTFLGCDVLVLRFLGARALIKINERNYLFGWELGPGSSRHTQATTRARTRPTSCEFPIRVSCVANTSSWQEPILNSSTMPGTGIELRR
ncbi:hypothetical protein B0I37DRAFT_64342 [Chaetomium sp. MPI-CAGE-AT-0009]|nr:hypothetical protein B0I37DRAFT_64342 [Chaetomium sp. MPI-CAGE-AT-0009]